MVLRPFFVTLLHRDLFERVPILTEDLRAAELLNSIPEPAPTQEDSKEPTTHHISPLFTQNPDPAEAELEAAEVNKYLLAKSLFDCREYDRCAAVFLPDSVLAGIVSSNAEDASATPQKGRAAVSIGTDGANMASRLPRLSQKSLFLALYAKVISGEKRKDEDAEMVMGPHDLGTATNRQLRIVSAYLNQWFSHMTNEDGEHSGSQGWLEYLSVL